jgi:anaerobic magnesium-protoporphyrin IX monomethyl ester cyclase
MIQVGKAPKRLPSQLPVISVPVPKCDGVKLMLINPPQSYPIELSLEYQSYFPVGIASLGAAAEPTGAEVKLLDCLAYDGRRREGDLVWFGLDFEGIRRQIEAFKPHIVGITNAFSMFISDALSVAELVKSVDPNIKVLMGGVEPSLSPNNTRLLRKNTSLDVLIKGEGELTLRDLLAHFSLQKGDFFGLSEVHGILFRDEAGQVSESQNRPWIEDLDSLPLPAYHLLDMDMMFQNRHYAKWRWRAKHTRCLPVHTSRGCPYSCSFCSVHSQVGKPNRRHTPATVVKHIELLKSRYGVTHVHFEDDNLTLNPKHTIELFEALKPLKITFDTPNGIRADTVTPDVARLFREAGATAITIAVESGVQWVLDKVVRKALDLKDVQTAAHALDAEDITCLAFFIAGFPGETETEIRQTLRYAKDLARDHGVINMLFVANPLPGTPLNKECEENGYLLEELGKRSIFCGIRLNQDGLVATKDFTKERIFNWAREELDTGEIVSVGMTTPSFAARSERGLRRMSQFLGQDVTTMRPYPWQAGYRARSAPAVKATSGAISAVGI